MKKLLLIIATVMLLGPAPGGAYNGELILVQAQGQPGKKGQGEYQRGGKESRREKGGRPPRDERHQGRMTDEQRRELHRDLDRANREIYRGNKGW